MRHSYEFSGVTIFSYSFELIDSKMYMIRGTQEVLIVDPCVDYKLLEDVKGIQQAIVFLSHEHYDHISGVNWLKEHMCTKIYCSDICAEAISNSQMNMTKLFPFLFLNDKEKYTQAKKMLENPYFCSADITFSDSFDKEWEGHHLEMRKAPGHSPGSSLLFLDNKILFAGDSLLGNGQELKSKGASAEIYKREVIALLKEKNPDMIVFPGHGESNTLKFFLEKIEEV